MLISNSFNESFSALTGYEPMAWQTQLYERFVDGHVPAVCDIPTGLGKTNVMAIWLITLAQDTNHAIPRRLVYIVNAGPLWITTLRQEINA